MLPRIVSNVFTIVRLILTATVDGLFRVFRYIAITMRMRMQMWAQTKTIFASIWRQFEMYRNFTIARCIA